MNNRLMKNDSGQGMVEYGLILALVSVVSIGALTGVGGGVKDKLEQVSGALKGEGVTESPSNVGIYSEDELDKLITEGGRIPIATAEELDSLRNNTKQTFGAGTKWEGEFTSGMDKKYIQVSDIDLSANKNFEPIGWWNIPSDNDPFTGEYDGGGYVINNLKINRPSESNVGLFGRTIGSRIENVGLNDLEVIGKNNVGGLAGSQTGSSTINSYASGKVSGDRRVGGLIGEQYSSSTTVNSYANGKVTGSSQVGGLLGYVRQGSIKNSGWNKDLTTKGIGDIHSIANVDGDTIGYNTEVINEIIKNLIK